MRDPMNGTGVSIYNVDSETIEGHSNGLSDLLNNARNHILEQPNMGILRKERLQRNKMAMKAISSSIADHVMGKSPIGREAAAALCIQRHFRGYLARKQYVKLLYEQYEKEEAEQLEKIRQQVEEGQMMLVENYRLRQEMEESECLRRNKKRNEDCSAVTIQRMWRQYSGKLHEKLVGLKNGHCDLKDGQDGKRTFNSFAVSPFEDDFYEEDLFNNQSECEEELQSCSESEPADEVGSRDMLAGKPELEVNEGYFSRRLSINSETTDLDKELPPPTTDWESIDNCLKSDAVQSTDNQYSPDPKVINRLSTGPDYLQLCFGDDNALSDEEERQEEAEIKEYVIQEYNDKTEDDAKRDSGCIMKGEEVNVEPADVKIIRPEELESTEISEEETTQVLLELESVNRRSDEQRGTDALRKQLERFSVRHLETQIRDLRLKIKEISDDLVQELLIRDQLHTKQDALLMDVEDAVKYAQKNHKIAQKSVLKSPRK